MVAAADQSRLQVEFPDDPEMRCRHETIYLSLYVQARGALRRELTAHLRTRREQRQPQHRPERRKGRLVDTIHISQRPAEAADRAVPGHWEGDLILGKAGGSAIGTLVERSTRFVMLVPLPGGRTAEDFAEAARPDDAHPARAAAPVADLGPGQGDGPHQQIAIDADMPVYFCDPRSPWQRGSNENTNGLLRQYFPKTSASPVHPRRPRRRRPQAQRPTPPNPRLATPAQRLEQLLCGHPINRGATTG